MALQTKRVPIDSVKQDPRNARLHPKENLAAIQESLSRFGQVQPIVVDKRTRIIIGGNGTHAALKEMGRKQVEIVEFDSTNEAEVRALALALNRTGELSKWDWETLRGHIEEIQKEGLPLIGWTDAELEPLLAANFELAQNLRPLDDFAENDPNAPAKKTLTFDAEQWDVLERFCGLREIKDENVAAEIVKVIQSVVDAETP